MRHILVLSDLHLGPATRADQRGTWPRQPIPDRQLATLLDRVYAQIGSAPLELVLNGDIFDFACPAGIPGQAAPPPAGHRGLEARARLTAILDGHELFLTSLARVLQRGDGVIFIAGNQDLPLGLPTVRNGLIERLVQQLRSQFPNAHDYHAYERIRFRSWYYQTPDGVHIEHGNQYDRDCAVAEPTAPLGPRRLPQVQAAQHRLAFARMRLALALLTALALAPPIAAAGGAAAGGDAGTLVRSPDARGGRDVAGNHHAGPAQRPRDRAHLWGSRGRVRPYANGLWTVGGRGILWQQRHLGHR